MSSSHAEMLDDVAVYALGTLPAEDAQRVREHLATCDECRDEYEALLPSVTAVGYSAESCTDAQNGAVYASPLLKARIMREVRASAAPAAKATTSSSPQQRNLWPLLTAACFVLALVFGLISVSLMSQLRSAQGELAHEEEPHALPAPSEQIDERTLADLVDEKAKRYVVPGGEIVKSNNRLYITMHDMAAPPKGKIYQAWTQPKGSKKMVPQPIFAPDKRGVVVVKLNADASKTHAVAVSIEPPGGSKAPTTSPIVLELLE